MDIALTTNKNYTTQVNKASTPPKVGIADGGSANNTHNGVLIRGEGDAFEAGVSRSFSPWEADGVDVGVDGGAPSLVQNVSSSKENSCLPSLTSSKWSRQQKRGYHRVQTVLQYWQAHGFQVLWVMLSTATGGDASKLAYHHQILRQRVEYDEGKVKRRHKKRSWRGLGYEGMQHYQVRTSEGNGVLHIFWAWRARDGYRQRSFYVEQDWLSKQWQDIHGAPIVWICRVRRGRVSRNKVSRYCMAQYVGQQSGYEYMSWSWGRTFGFPLVACWQWFKRHTGNKSRLLFWWSRFLFGGLVIGVPRAGQVVNMGIIRVKYNEWGSELWAIS